jgi:hypothetical protein
MKIQLGIILTGFALTSPSFAKLPILGKALQHAHSTSQSAHTIKNYPDFSGNWVGTCTDDEDENSMTIKIHPSGSSIEIDNVAYPIDAIFSQNTQANFEFQNTNFHMRWSSNGQQLLTSANFFYKEGHLSKGELGIGVGQTKMFLENKRLHVDGQMYFFNDGVLSNQMIVQCVFDKQA